MQVQETDTTTRYTISIPKVSMADSSNWSIWEEESGLSTCSQLLF